MYMPIFERIKFAAVLTVCLVGVLMIVDMVGGFDWGAKLFSFLFYIPAFVILFVAAPYIKKFIRYK
jgi:hypothetical protein